MRMGRGLRGEPQLEPRDSPAPRVPASLGHLGSSPGSCWPCLFWERRSLPAEGGRGLWDHLWLRGVMCRKGTHLGSRPRADLVAGKGWLSWHTRSSSSPCAWAMGASSTSVSGHWCRRSRARLSGDAALWFMAAFSFFSETFALGSPCTPHGADVLKAINPWLPIQGAGTWATPS